MKNKLKKISYLKNIFTFTLIITIITVIGIIIYKIFKKNCPIGVNNLICSGNGDCDKNKCICNLNYYGDECQYKFECLKDTECKGNQKCIKNKCKFDCIKNTDCTDNKICENNQCKLECTTETESTDCKSGLICVNNRCEAGCDKDTDCANGLKCKNNVCTYECTLDSDCGENQTCDKNICQDCNSPNTLCKSSSGLKKCVNLQTDINNCGSCDKIVPNGTICVNGKPNGNNFCGDWSTGKYTFCQDNQLCCGGTCINYDDNNCGACNTKCSPGNVVCNGKICNISDGSMSCFQNSCSRFFWNIFKVNLNDLGKPSYPSPYDYSIWYNNMDQNVIMKQIHSLVGSIGWEGLIVLSIDSTGQSRSFVKPIVLADSCNGWSCTSDQVNQVCKAGKSGAGDKNYICDGKNWQEGNRTDISDFKINDLNYKVTVFTKLIGAVPLSNNTSFIMNFNGPYQYCLGIPLPFQLPFDKINYLDQTKNIFTITNNLPFAQEYYCMFLYNCDKFGPGLLIVSDKLIH